MRSWMVAVFFLFGGGIALASPVEEARRFPLIVEGQDDYFYHLLTYDSEVEEDEYGGIYGKNPVLGRDGTALYEGYRLGEPGVRVTLSFQQLLDGRLLKNVFPRIPEVESPWLGDSLRLKADMNLVRGLVEAMEADPELFLSQMSSMTDSTAEVLGQLLFGSSLQLSGDVLRDFRRTAEQPEPGPTQFDLEISWDLIQEVAAAGDVTASRVVDAVSKKPSLKNRLIGGLTDRLFDIVYSVQLEDVRFEVASRRVVFDPNTDRFLVELWLDDLEFEGNILSQVDVKFPASFPARDGLRHSLGLGSEFQRVRSGKISGGVFLSFSFHLRREEEQGFWVLETAPGTSPQLEFLPPAATREEEIERSWVVTVPQRLDEKKRAELSSEGESWTPIIYLEIETVDRQGNPVVDSVEYPISGPIFTKIVNDFRSLVAPALQFRSLMDQWGWAHQRLFNAEDGQAQAWTARSRLGDFRVHPNGLEFEFDMKMEVDQKADCLSHLSPSWHSSSALSTEKQANFSGEDEILQPLWAIVWNRLEDEKWQLGRLGAIAGAESAELVTRQRFQELQPEPEGYWWLNVNEEALNATLEAGFWAGELCRSTRQIWPRLATTPLIVITPEGPPRVDFVKREEGVEGALEFPFSLQSFARDDENIFESFKRGQLSRSFLLKGNLQLDESPNRPDRLRLFTDLRAMELSGPAYANRNIDLQDLGPGEAESLLRLILVVARQVGFLPDESLRLDWPPSIELEDYRRQVNEAQNWFDLNRLQMSQEALEFEFKMSSNFEILKNLKSDDAATEKVSASKAKRPQTRWVELPPYRVFEERVRLRWAQVDLEQDALYSYRVQRPDTEAGWGKWSPFQSEEEVFIRLREPGLYRVQVVAMNPEFQLESRVHAEAAFYFEGSSLIQEEQVSDPSPSTSSKDTERELENSDPEGPRESRSLPLSSEPEQSRGVFGCQLKMESMTSSSFGWWVFFVFLVFLLQQRRRARFF